MYRHRITITATSYIKEEASVGTDPRGAVGSIRGELDAARSSLDLQVASRRPSSQRRSSLRSASKRATLAREKREVVHLLLGLLDDDTA